MTRTPCYSCEERTQTCHGKCERYIEWQKIHEEEKEQERAERYSEYIRHRKY